MTGPVTSSSTVVPAGGATRLPTTKPRLRGEDPDRVRGGRASSPPGRPTARRMSCSCIHTSSGRLDSSVSQVQATSAGVRGGAPAASVGGSARSSASRVAADDSSSSTIAAGVHDAAGEGPRSV